MAKKSTLEVSRSISTDWNRWVPFSTLKPGRLNAGPFALLPVGLVKADTEMGMFSCHEEDTFGIHVNNDSPGTNSIYIYGPTNDNAWIDAYDKESLDPFDAGSYTIVMYGNLQGSHTYTFNNQSDTNSDGWASFNTGKLPSETYCNSFTEFTWNGL